MKYAIISDIHGNSHAFRAVLADAEKNGADAYLLLGDYASSFPWGNDVVNAMRELAATKRVTAIAGNGEGYFEGLRGQTDFSHEQFKPVYWSYLALSAENLDYLSTLPETAVVQDPDSNTKIHLNHDTPIFYRKNSPQIELFHPRNFRDLMRKKKFSHEEYLTQARDALLSRDDAMAEINALPDGVHLFGHNHLQFHTRFGENGNKLFINPGSCGEPLDFNPTASYTLLSLTANDAKNETAVEERRVQYDRRAAAEALAASEFTAYAPVWSNIMKKELETGIDHFGIFVRHIRETGLAMGVPENHSRPASPEVWNQAVKTWDTEKI